MPSSDDPDERRPGGREPAPLRRLIRELRPFRGRVLLCVALTAAQSGVGFVPPLLLGDIVNRLTRGEPVDTPRYLGLVVGFALVQGLLGYALAVSMASLGQHFMLALRERMLAHMQALPLAYFEKNQAGKLVSNVVNDVATINGLITSNLSTMVSDAFQLVLVVVVLFFIQPTLALMSLAVAPLYAINFRRLYLPLQATSEEVRAKRDQMFGGMQEKLAGVQTVKGFGQERWEAKTFMSTTRELMVLNVRQGTLSGGLWTLMDALCGVATGAVLFVGGLMCLRGQMEPGTLVMFLLYSVTYVYGPVVRFLTAMDPVARAQAALTRIFRTLDTENVVEDAPDAVEMPPIRGAVQLEGVWFEYEPGQPVLRGIDLDVRPGQVVALVGFSGSGKTTVASLLLRHYDPTGGRIRVDGMDLRDVKLESYRRQVGVVQQESVLFSTTLRENIRYGRLDATDAEVEDAAKAAAVHDTIVALPEGYETKIGEEGVRLSVGEKQRVAIARALLADPRILILDEATSSLDSATEAALQSALETLMRGRTSFVVAHRLSTIVGADVIVVMEAGRIVEQGSHEELLDLGRRYASLYREQFRVVLEAV